MSKEKRKKIDDYYYDVFDDYLFFTKNLEEVLPKYDIVFKDKNYLEYLNSHLQSIYEDRIYPSSISLNIKKLLEYIEILLKKENVKDKLNIYYTMYGRFMNENIENSYEIYYLEYCKKFSNLKDHLENNIHMISKEYLEKSICLDYINLLSFKLDLSKNLSLLEPYINNNYYLASIRKFLIDTPELFSDSSIQQRVLKILKCNIQLVKKFYVEENKNQCDRFLEENQQLMNKIKNINSKNNENFFLICDLKDCYNLISMKKILSSFDMEKELEENQMYFCNDYFMEYIDNFIKENDDILESRVVTKLARLACFIRDKSGTNEIKIRCNQILANLDKIERIDSENILYSIDFLNKTTRLERMLKVLFTKINEEDDIKEIRQSMKYDFDLMRIYFDSKEEFQKSLKSIEYGKNFIYTMRLFIEEYPSFFSEPMILERTKLLLKQSMEYSESYLEKRKIKLISKQIERINHE